MRRFVSLKNVSYFISSENGITYAPYENAVDLLNAIKNDNVDYIAVPKLRYLSSIIENKYLLNKVKRFTGFLRCSTTSER